MPTWLEVELLLAMILGPPVLWLINRFMSLSARITKLESGKDDLKATLDRMEAKLDELDRKVDGLTERVVKVETWVELQK